MGTTILTRNSEETAPPSTAALVFMFPGQSSVGPDVVSRACLAHPAAATVADLARAVLGDARASAYLDAGGTRLRSNRDTQIMATVLAVDYDTVGSVVERARAYPEDARPAFTSAERRSVRAAAAPAAAGR